MREDDPRPSETGGLAELEPPGPEEPEEPPPLELWRAVGDVTPWGTLLLVLAWGILFAVMTVGDELGDTLAMLARGANAPSSSAAEALWRSLASTFLHGSATHVLLNALTLLVLGQAVERIFARGGFAIVCAVGGAVASFGSLAWRAYHAPAHVGISLGGSGLVFALGGALLAVSVRLRPLLAVGRARAFGAVILLLTLPALSAGFQRDATDNAAHLAGLSCGIVLGAGLPLHPGLGGPGSSPLARGLGAVAALLLLTAFGLALLGQGWPGAR